MNDDELDRLEAEYTAVVADDLAGEPTSWRWQAVARAAVYVDVPRLVAALRAERAQAREQRKASMRVS